MKRALKGANMSKKKQFSIFPIITDGRGFSLAELLIAAVIMIIVIFAVQEIIIRTVDVVARGGAQNVAQASVETVVNKIAEDLRGAGKIRDGSSGTSVVFTRYGINLDAFAPGNFDMADDETCYRFIAPVGSNPFNPGYRPGYIEGGVGSGTPPNTCWSSGNYYPLTDPMSDIREFQIEYCRPTGAGGNYACWSGPINNSLATGDSPLYDAAYNCVWLIKISVKYSRRFEKAAPNSPKAVYTYQTALSPRNIFFGALMTDKDKDDIADCCDADYNAANSATWCPPPQTP